MCGTIVFGQRENREINEGWGLVPDPMERSLAQTWWRSSRTPGLFFPSYDEDAFWPTMVPGSYQQIHDRLEFFEGLVTYRVHFAETPAGEGERVFLYFEGVGDRCRVFLNGRWVGEHDGSHTGFSFDVTKDLKAENRLMVFAECKRKVEAVPGVMHDWFHYGGIHRPVRIVRVPDVFVAEADCRLRLTDAETAEIAVRCRVVGGNRFESQAVRFELRAPETGEVVCEGVIDAFAGEWADFRCTVSRDGLALWEPGAAAFHELHFWAGDDHWWDRVGLREVRVEGKDVLVNGKAVFLKGSASWTTDPERGIFSLGEEMSARTVAALRGINANFTRAGHAPPSREFVRACDEAGILLWLEVPAYWKPDMHHPAQSRLALKCLEEMVATFRLSPSVVMWSVGNECAYHDPVEPKTNIAYFLEAVAWLKANDPTRLITYTGGLEGEVDPSDDRTCPAVLMRELDLIGLNCYAGQTDGAISGAPSKFPVLIGAIRRFSGYGKPVILAEAGIDAVRGERGFDFGEDRQVDHYQSLLKIILDEREQGYLQGVSFFALADFRTPIKLGRFQDGYNRKGIMTIDLIPKKAYDVVAEAFAGNGEALSSDESRRSAADARSRSRESSGEPENPVLAAATKEV